MPFLFAAGMLLANFISIAVPILLYANQRSEMKVHVKTIEDYQPNWIHPKNEPEPGKDRKY